VQAQRYRVRLAARVKDDLRRIGKKYGKKSYETVRDLIKDLEFEPEKKGERLSGRLKGLYSLHYSRFRIIYAIDNQELVVAVIGTGWHENESRRDIYKLIERALDSGIVTADDADKPQRFDTFRWYAKCAFATANSVTGCVIAMSNQ
jgi:addiction module RelE/StbE family toxin